MTDTPLSDDVVEAAATAIYESIFVDEWTGGNGVEAAQYRQAARAALEAATYGEMVEALTQLATTEQDSLEHALAIGQARALLSSIGASHDR